jgi:hypothetical protein
MPSTAGTYAVNAVGPLTVTGNVIDSATIHVNLIIANTITASAGIASTSLISSNSTADQGQTVTIVQTLAGGEEPYTYNFIVTNTATGNVIASQIFAGCTLATNTFTFVMPSTAGTYAENALGPLTVTSNVIDHTTFTAGVSNFITSNTMTVASAPSLTISPSAASVVVDNPNYGGTNPIETYTLTITGGTRSSNFQVEVYNITGSTQLGSNVLIPASGGSNVTSFLLISPGAFTYNAISADLGTTSPYVFSSAPSTISTSAFVGQIVSSSGGSPGGGSGVTPSPTTVATTTATTTTPTTTIPVLLNASYNLSAGSVKNISGGSGTIISLASASSGPARLVVSNVTGSVTPPKNYTPLNVFNVSTISSANVSTTITIPYNCAFPSSNLIVPYKLERNGTWVAIVGFSVNTTTCRVTFKIPPDPIVGLFQYQKPAVTSTAATTTILPTTVASSTIAATIPQAVQSGGHTALVVITVVVIIIIVIALFAVAMRKRKR